MKKDIKKILRETANEKSTVQDELFNLPLEVRREIQRNMEDLVSSEEVVEEQLSYKGIPEYKAQGFFGKVFKIFKRYLTDKASEFLVNSSTKEQKETIQILKAMDPTDLSGIFKPRAMYLGGGIDFASDALSWRTKVEDFFGEGHIVKGDRLLNLVTNGDLSFEGLDIPAILNPLRAETVRDEDHDFQELFKKWKANELTGEEFKTFQEKIRQQIVVQDLYMLNACDTNLIAFDGTAGAGTFGEAQVSALKNMQVFLWLTNTKTLANVSPWLLPSVTKILKDDDVFEFLSNFK